jgi:sugar (pentulose or hexulose) kinase
MSTSICVLNLGLKSIRAAVFDDGGRLRSIAYRPIETRMGEGLVEQDPDLWWAEGRAAMQEALRDPMIRRDVGHVTVTASAGCLVAMAADGSVVRPAIMISDVRARAQAAAIAASPAYRALGLASRVTPDLMLPKLAWLREHEPEQDAAARWLLTPNDFLVHRLTGEVLTDPANASKYFHAPGTGYPRELLRALGLDEARLPAVATGSDTTVPLRPAVIRELDLPPRTVAVLSTYDAICAAYGSGVARLGDACDVSGTVTSFRVVTDRPDPDPDGRVFITPHVGSGRYLAGGSNNLAGGVIEWAKQTLYPVDQDPYAVMVDDVSGAPPGAAGLMFLPYLLGERAPVWDATARGVFFGLGRNHGRADMTRAVFEGVAYSVLDIADRLAAIGVHAERVWASGGVARFGPINQIKADMLGLPVRLTEELETTALGAAILAGVNRGIWGSIEEATAACVRTAATYEPDAPRTRMYADFFGVYRQLYERLRGLFAERAALIDLHAEVLRTELVRSENL